MFIVLSSWPQGHCESSLGSFDECRTAPSSRRRSTLRPSHVTWAVSSPVGNYRLQPSSPFIIITQPESWYSFTPRSKRGIYFHGVEGWVDLGTAGKVHTARAQGCKSQWLCDKHNYGGKDLWKRWVLSLEWNAVCLGIFSVENFEFLSDNFQLHFARLHSTISR